MSDLGQADNPNTTQTKDYEMCEWWCTSAEPEGIRLWGGMLLHQRDDADADRGHS